MNNAFSIKYAGAPTLLLGDRSNYEQLNWGSYTVGKWYWIFCSRSQSSGLLSQVQYVGIYDPTISNYVKTESEDWGLLFYMASLSSSNFYVIANGFKPPALGFCGRLRGLIIMPGTSVPIASAYEFLGQQQGGAGLNKLVLFMPFDARTGQWAKDGSGSTNDGVLGSTPYTDLNDPAWEAVR